MTVIRVLINGRDRKVSWHHAVNRLLVHMFHIPQNESNINIASSNESPIDAPGSNSDMFWWSSPFDPVFGVGVAYRLNRYEWTDPIPFNTETVWDKKVPRGRWRMELVFTVEDRLGLLNLSDRHLSGMIRGKLVEAAHAPNEEWITPTDIIMQTNIALGEWKKLGQSMAGAHWRRASQRPALELAMRAAAHNQWGPLSEEDYK